MGPARCRLVLSVPTHHPLLPPPQAEKRKRQEEAAAKAKAAAEEAQRKVEELQRRMLAGEEVSAESLAAMVAKASGQQDKEEGVADTAGPDHEAHKVRWDVSCAALSSMGFSHEKWIQFAGNCLLLVVAIPFDTC